MTHISPEQAKLARASELRHKTIFNLGAKRGSYVWLHDDHLILPKKGGTVTFEAKGGNDIHISFHKDTLPTVGQDGVDGSPTYEIVIGGWMNYKTGIRKCGKQQAIVSKRDNPDAVITERNLLLFSFVAGDFTAYWVQLVNGEVRVGKGTSPPFREILSWKDPHPEEACYIGLRYISDESLISSSSWDTPLQFRSFEVLPFLPSPKGTLTGPFRFVNSSPLSDLILQVQGQELFAHQAILAAVSPFFWEKFQENSFTPTRLAFPDLSVNQALLFLEYSYGDVTLIVEETERIPSHRVILSLSSDLFYAMFTSSFKETFNNEVPLEDLSVSQVKLLLQYFYTKNVSFENVDEALGLLEVADRFCLSECLTQCKDYLSSYPNIESACQVLEIAHFYHIGGLEEEMLRFIEDHFDAVSRTEGFLSLDLSHLLALVKSDNLWISTEEKVFESLQRWMAADPSRPSSSLPLLLHLRYPLMSKEYLETVILPNELFADPELSKKVRKAISFLSFDKKRSRNPSNVSINVTGNTLSLLSTKSPDFSLRPRKGSNYKDLLFAFPGDSNGVFYWIGTNGRTTNYNNPFKLSLVNVTSSVPFTRYSRPEALVGRSFLTTSYIKGENAWWKVDLSPRTLICNHYSLYADGGDAFPRNWKLEGSIDDSTWVLLRSHEGDETITMPGQKAAWAISGAPATTPFKMFRIMNTGNAHNGSNILAICGLELYGYLLEEKS